MRNLYVIRNTMTKHDILLIMSKTLKQLHRGVNEDYLRRIIVLKIQVMMALVTHLSVCVCGLERN